MVTLSTSRPFLADKKLRALALDADARWSGLPDVPLLAERAIQACRGVWRTTAR